MAVLDEGLDAAPVEGDGGRRSFPATVADRTPGEWRSLYERQHARADRERTRADAAEARCEDLRWAEVASRSDAGWWKSRFKACRRKLSAAEDEMKELRRAARDVSSLRAEAARLEMLLSQAVGPSTGAGTIEALSKEVVRLRTALASSQARGDSAGRRSAGEARRVRTALEEARQRKDAILSLVRRRLPEDWTARYNTTPVLIETFVETPRYTGAVYKASGWIRVGTTQGRGRYDRDKLYDKPKKDIWLRPLRKDWKRTLNR